MEFTKEEKTAIVNVLTAYSGYNGTDALLIAPLIQKLKAAIEESAVDKK